MMAGEVQAVYDALVAMLESIDGTGSYTYDLSAAVERRRFTGQTTSVPRAYLSPSEPFCQYAVDGFAELGSYALTMQFDLVIAVSAGAANTPENKLSAAVLAVDDVLTAIQADRSLGQTALDVVPVLGSIDGAEVGASSLGIAYGLLTVTTLAPGGAA